MGPLNQHPHFTNFEVFNTQTLHTDAPLLIFLPGMDGTSLSLQNQRINLETRFHLRYLTLPSDDVTDWDGLVSSVLMLVNAEKASCPHRLIYLCGESFGGCLALKLVAHSPEWFDRLILINPASSCHQQFWKSWGPELVEQTPSSLYQLATVGFLPFLISLHRTANENRLALLKAMQSVTPRSVAWRLSLLRDFRLEKLSLARFTKPTLVIAGGADQLLASSSEAERIAKFLPQLQAVTLPHSGHACLLEVGINLYKILMDTQFLG